MNKPKQNKNNKKSLLIDNLYNYIENNSEDTLELKPQQFQLTNNGEDFSLLRKDDDLEQYKKDYSSKIDKQIIIISQNIMNSLFGLNNQKFTAFISRYNVWGFDLTMQQFIINFYLVVKTDNMLRQFVMDHMDKIINVTRSVSQKYLITHMNEFRFRETRTDYNRKKILDQLKQNQKDIKEKLQNKDLSVKQEQVSNNTTNNNTTSPSTNANTTTTNNVEIIPFEAQVAGNENNVPKILSMDQIMNMSDEDLQHLDEVAKQQQVPQIENNMEGVQVQPETEEEQQEKQEEQNKTQQNKSQNEQQSQMEQQILNNLRKQHQNLQRGFTNNG